MKEKILHHFYFRIKQFFRILELNPRLSIPTFLVFLGYIFIKFPENYPPLFVLFIVSIFHFRRKDIGFLKKIFQTEWRIIIFIESAIIFLFLLLVNINYKLDVFGICCFLINIIFTFFHSKAKSQNISNWNFIPSILFEWKSFFRRNTILIFFAYIILLLSTYHIAIFLICVSNYIRKFLDSFRE